MRGAMRIKCNLTNQIHFHFFVSVFVFVVIYLQQTYIRLNLILFWKEKKTLLVYYNIPFCSCVLFSCRVCAIISCETFPFTVSITFTLHSFSPQYKYLTIDFCWNELTGKWDWTMFIHGSYANFCCYFLLKFLLDCY